LSSTFTVDELVDLLRHSVLPVILVEGVDDVAVYRFVEDLIGPTSGSVLPCGGRDTLLSVFRRRGEFPNTPVAFIADRDMWVFGGPPPDLRDIVWTEGYSIENDAYDVSLERLLSPAERTHHSRLLDLIAEWFAFAVERHRCGHDVELNCHVNRISADGICIDSAYASEVSYAVPQRELRDRIRINYRTLLRGKQLMQCLVRFLSASDRRTKHSTNALLEIGAKAVSNDRIRRIAEEARERLQRRTRAQESAA
jgi:hypothetical protein